MSITLGVLLWAQPGLEDALSDYEDEVLGLLDDHDGRVVSRLRLTDDGGPTELQVIEFGSSAGFDSYLADPRRAARADERDRVIARTELLNGSPR
jgi:hypothetical protein